ncbi:MAG: [FeFe] hydrogenase H-cluster maturation GTPase HydF [Oscillospiraceae bacterium]
MDINKTPNADRLHIGIFGKRNAGKSSLINALTGQNSALVSQVAGTTTDPVYKAMEVMGVGACVFIDTAGFDDNDNLLGDLRLQKTNDVLQKTDIAIMIFCDENIEYEIEWIEKFNEKNIPIIPVINKADILTYSGRLAQIIIDKTKLEPLFVSSINSTGIKELLSEISKKIPTEFQTETITGHLVSENDVVMLVMPQDSQAPKGRLILPQVQTIRDLLNFECTVICTTLISMQQSLSVLKQPPKLIICDSQVFQNVYEIAPNESKLTSFSVLFAKYKGDLDEFIKGANAIDNLNENSTILIAEACTHSPLSEDIGRVKIPNLLRKKVGENINIEFVSGVDFPTNLSKYDLVIHCGGCMFNKKYIMSRIEIAKNCNVPITNYGILIAKMKNILEKITF